MSKFVRTDLRIFSGGCDFTTMSNKLEVETSIQEEDATNYGSGGWEELVAGAREGSIAVSGFWEAGDLSKVDDQAWASMGSVAGMTAIESATATYGDLAWLSQMLSGKYVIGDEVNKIAPFSLEGPGSGPLVRGIALHPPGTARTATGTGTATQHVAVPSGKRLYATLHVLSVSGTGTPTLTVAVQSDADSGFASPISRIAFAAATAIGGQFAYADAPITDTWYRVSHTISGTNPSFLYAVAIGVM
jgi:hypothetical protein